MTVAASSTSTLTGLAARFLPVVLGARVGDAMGAPTEGMAPEEIAHRFGWVAGFVPEKAADHQRLSRTVPGVADG